MKDNSDTQFVISSKKEYSLVWKLYELMDKINKIKPETISTLLKSLEPYGEKIVDLVTKYFDKQEKEKELEIKLVEMASKHDQKIVYVLLGFLGLVIGILAGLTYYGKVSGEALLFAVGGLVGYVFATIQRFIFGSQRAFLPDPE